MHPNLYLFFAGDCLEAMTHYADLLGGEIVSVTKNSDAASPDDRMPGGDHMVMNMAVRFDTMTLFASDNPSDMYQTPQGFRVQLDMPSAAEFDRVFQALSVDARNIAMPPGETFWAERFTMFTDRFGTPWMLNFGGKMVTGNTEQITVEIHVPVPPEQAWSAYTDAQAIMQWNFASSDWHCPSAEVDLRVGGRLCARMEAKDGSFGFDYEGVYERVDAPNLLALILGEGLGDGGRRVETSFLAEAGGTRVTTTFDTDGQAPIDMQRQGWQAILDNYAAYLRRES